MATTKRGNSGNNSLTGSNGDTLIGGGGNDTFNVTGTGVTINDLSGRDVLKVNAGASASATVTAAFTATAATQNSGTATLTSAGFDVDLSLVTTGNGFTITGTGGTAMRLKGSAKNDAITGGNGNDTITGGDGADNMDGGNGNDTFVIAGTADVDSGEVINGGANTASGDTISVTASTDFIGATTISNIENISLASGVTATFTGAQVTGQTWVVNGVAGGATEALVVNADTATTVNLSFVTANNVTVSLVGDGGSEILTGTAGNDTLTGGGGTDTFNVQGTDTITDLDNTDTLNVASGATAVVNLIDLSGAVTVNNSGTINMTGTSGRDNMIGSSGTSNESMNGGAGNDSLTGNGGDDTLDGGSGADVMKGGLGDDTYIVDNIADSVVELTGGGTDTVESSITYTLTSHVENLTLTGSRAINGTGNSEDNTLNGNSAANVLTGGAGDDVLDGKAGADKLYGGTGNDEYYVDNAGDKVYENASEGNDTVYASASYTLSDYVEDLILIGTGNISGTGNDENNDITGNAGNNVLNGGAGDDSLLGMAGNDMLNGGTGIDTLEGGNGNDTLKGGAGNDDLTGGVGNDLFNVEAGTDTINDFADGTDTLTVASGAGATVDVDSDFTATSATKNNSTDNTQVELRQQSGVSVINLAASAGTTGYTVTLNHAGSDAAQVTGTKYADIIDATGSSSSTYHTIVGGAGNDTIKFDTQNELVAAAVHGESGTDTLEMTAGVTLIDTDFDQVFEVEKLQLTGANSVTLGTYTSTAGLATITGGSGIDTINASNSLIATSLNGAVGADVITGSGYADTITGGAGADNLTGGAGNDTFDFTGSDAAIDTITDWGVGTDTLAGTLASGGQLNVTIDNGSTTAFTAAVIAATNGKVSVTGGTGDDNITGGAGNDTINSGTGDDVVYSSAGTDVINFSSGDDTFVLRDLSHTGWTISGFDESTSNDKFDLSQIVDGLSNENHFTFTNVTGGVTATSTVYGIIGLDGITGSAITDSTVAAALASATDDTAYEDAIVLALVDSDTGSDGPIAVWLWEDSGDGNADVAELTLIGTFTGTGIDQAHDLVNNNLLV